MKKLLYLLCLAFLVVGFASCENKEPDKPNNNTEGGVDIDGDGKPDIYPNDPNNPNNPNNPNDPNNPNSGNNGGNTGADGNIDPVVEVLSPAKQKERFTQVGDDFIAQFNSTDFKSLIKLIDECSYKFEEYNWEAYENNILDEKNFIGKLSKIITEAQTGGMPVNMDAYIFSMDRISAKYVADDATQSWDVTPTRDGKLTIQFTNLIGEPCEIIVSTSGDSYDMISYYEEYHYDYDYNTGIDNSYESAQPFEVVVPENINIIIKEGDYEHLNATCNIRLEKNKLFDLNWTARLASLTFNVKSKIDNKSAESTFSVDQYKQNLIYMTAAAPSCSLLGKKDSDSMEEWINKYDEAFYNQKTIIGNLTTVFNLMNRVQIIGTCEDPMSITSDIDDLYDNYDSDSRQFNIKATEILNDAMNFDLYYSSNVKQASLKWDVTHREREIYDWQCQEYINEWGYWDQYCNNYVVGTETEYYYSPVIYFPEENTSYSFSEYFTSDIYSGLLEQAEDLCNSYIKMLRYIDVDPIDITE